MRSEALCAVVLAGAEQFSGFRGGDAPHNREGGGWAPQRSGRDWPSRPGEQLYLPIDEGAVVAKAPILRRSEIRFAIVVFTCQSNKLHDRGKWLH
jgi:hypothetical protein